MKNCRTGCPRYPHQAFTLIELLAVVGIVAILAAILFPVLNSAQERGKMAQCLSNVRQWGTANMMYLSDSQGSFPERGEGSDGLANTASNASTSKAWFNVLPPYLGMLPISALANMPRPLDKSLYICPSAKPEVGLNDNSTYYCNYAQNCWIDSTGRGCSGSGAPRASGFGELLLLSQLKNPAVFPIIAENATGLVGAQPAYKLAYTHARIMGSPASGDAFRHNSMANIAFADGHAASFKKEAIYTNSLPNNNYWNYGGIQWNPDNTNLYGACQ